MKCPECEGKGEIVDWGLNYTDSDTYVCGNCKGTGEVFSIQDPQPWDLDHGRWGRFTCHLESKWKNRFVVSGCEFPTAIVEFLRHITKLKYRYVQFNEGELFKGQNETYQYPCVYFYPENERKVDEPVTKEELTELYWY